MKPICPTCGGNTISFNPRRIFCSSYCCQALHNKRQRRLNLSRDFNIFQNIVAAAEDYNEFKQLYRRFFGKEFHCD